MKPKLKFKYNSPPNDRLKNEGFGVGSIEQGYWYFYKLKKWLLVDTKEYNDNSGLSNSTHAPCKSFRKFKKMLRKQPEMIGKLIYVTRYHTDDYNFNIVSVK